MEKDSDFQQLKKKRRKGNLLPGKCFVSPVSDDQMVVISKGFIPHKNTDWAMSCFREWRNARDRKSAEEDKYQCPEDLQEDPDIQELNY